MRWRKKKEKRREWEGIVIMEFIKWRSELYINNVLKINEVYCYKNFTLNRKGKDNI